MHTIPPPCILVRHLNAIHPRSHNDTPPSHPIYLAMYFALWWLDIRMKVWYLIDHNIGTVSGDTMTTMYNQSLWSCSNPESKLIDICKTGPKVWELLVNILKGIKERPLKHGPGTGNSATLPNPNGWWQNHWLGNFQVLGHLLNYFQLLLLKTCQKMVERTDSKLNVQHTNATKPLDNAYH